MTVNGRAFWVRWCESGRLTLSVTEPLSGASQSYSLNVVTPTPTPAPTATPTLTPTPTPRPPLPTLTPGPTPSLVDERGEHLRQYDLRSDGRLRSTNPEREQAIRRLHWVQDGIGAAEMARVQALIYLGRYGNRKTFETVMEQPWVVDGIDSHEFWVLQNLQWIARQSRDAAQAIAEMPFLETVEPADALAMESLGELAYFGEEESVEPLLAVLEHPSIADGITEAETAVVATLWGVANYSPALLDTLLDSEQVLLEENTIDLPLAGQVAFTIIRTRPGAAATMELLETAVRTVEMFMSLPFPELQVNYLFEEALHDSAGGTNFGTSITSLPRYDEVGYSEESARRHFAHETGHFYWGHGESWIKEGAATFLESIETNLEPGWPMEPERSPCAYFDTISELEQVESEFGDPEFWCNYSLGERLFHDLYRNMDDYDFRLAFRRLYLLSQIDDPGDDCEGTHLKVCHVRAAFTTDVPPETAAIAQKVINRWYDGSEPYDTSFLDVSPVDPSLPEINGRITAAYISWDVARLESTRMHSFSASNFLGSPYLVLEFDFPPITERQEPEFELVEYFEDGFTYNRRTVKRPGGYYDRVWFTVGDSPWIPGRHWVLVYNEGRKVAQVGYEITP